LQVATTRVLAAVMATAALSVWLLVSRWERSGRSAELRVRLRPTWLIGLGGDFAQVVTFFYPVVVVVAPAWAYRGWLNWSARYDVAIQAAGLVLWAFGMILLVWASAVLGRHMAINGVAVDHQLVTRGPYAFVRHPVYGSFTLIAVGTAMVFRSYLVLGLAVVCIVQAVWWMHPRKGSSPPPTGSATPIVTTWPAPAGSYRGSEAVGPSGTEDGPARPLGPSWILL
jgi:protein-S-isoprenylcysteine O-methyltransferase Ste14